MKKQVISALSGLTGAAVGFIAAAALGKTSNAEANKEKARSEKHFAMFLMMNRWVQVRQRGKSPADYLKEQNYRTVAIYGMSYIGERLLEELKDSEIKAAYGIDRNAESLYADIEIVTPEEALEEVDAVIVTSIFFMDEIRRDLSGKISCPIVSLEDILYEI